MGTSRLKSAWKLLRSDHYMLVTIKNNTADIEGAGRSDLAGMMMMSIELMKATKYLTDGIEDMAAEEGELKTYMELKKTLENIINE